ncbi:MAG: hybrid sensor histidine kinase/response regulator [Gammaproteobacteria bacterium]|nr:hybrid sensor histidine kinase/response regulator [Gammaproteobacteria bacterium]
MYSAKILIVDDNEANRELLCSLVEPLGHTPTLAEDGRVALTQIEKDPPDLVLLDIVMPEMDGFEVLHSLKSNLALAHIPVIMISAFDDMDSVVHCIEYGADDYLTKPFERALLKARINACLEKKELYDQKEHYRDLLENYSRTLEADVYDKTRELAMAHEKLQVLDKAKSDFLQLVSHELRTPLNALIGPIGMLQRGNLKESMVEDLLDLLAEASARLQEIVEQAELLNKIRVSGESAFSLVPRPAVIILGSAVDMLNKFAQSRQVSFAPLPDCEFSVLCEMDLLIKAFHDLLKTAVKFANKDTMVRLSCRQEEGVCHIGIDTTGQNIPEEYIDKFFEVFSIVQPLTAAGDLGLTPPVAERIISLFGGSVTVKNRKPAGLSFSVRLKLG